MKLIDAKSNLSVQVHPYDEQAEEWENKNGKTRQRYRINRCCTALEKQKLNNRIRMKICRGTDKLFGCVFVGGQG